MTSSSTNLATPLAEPINIDAQLPPATNTAESLAQLVRESDRITASLIMEAEETSSSTSAARSEPAANVDTATAAASSTTIETVASESVATTTTTTAPAPPAPTFTTQAEREAATSFLINFVGATCSIFTIATLDERRIAIEALRMAEHQRASLELQAATADETNTVYPQNYVFLDGHVVEIPPGIDPSFLSALPDSLRREVIMEQLRILGIDIRNRPIPPSATSN